MILDRDPEFTGTITAIFQEETGRGPTPLEMHVYLTACRNGMTGDQLREIIHNYDEAKAYRERPILAALPPLEVRGRDFIINGARTVLRGVDQFVALRQVIDGADLTPLIQESKKLNVNCWRVFGMASSKQNGYYDLRPSEPTYYEAVSTLAHLLADNGIYLLLVAYADNQDVQAGLDHWLRLGEVCGQVPTTLLSGGNEFSKNGFDPAGLTAPPLVWSRGSNIGDQKPPAVNGATFAEFHPRRDFTKSLDDAVASATFLAASGYNVPLVIDEPPRMGTDGSGAVYADPFVCWQFGRIYSATTAGAVFHSRSGQKGQLMDEATYSCAEAFLRGLTV
jgi:hypothetical protein